MSRLHCCHDLISTYLTTFSKQNYKKIKKFLLPEVDL